jgi:tripartite-type tricarboxylate transporter receptor subunit TctC
MTSLPEVPTVAETLPGFVSSAWFAVVAPPKTPQGIAAKINADINEALQQPDIVKRLADLSAEPVGGTTAAAAAFMRQEVERWRAVIKATGTKLE